jgi:hypothetical protein
MPDAMIGVREFVDGVEREVYLSDDGRQYVREGGRKVHGVWLLPSEPMPEPAVAQARPRSRLPPLRGQWVGRLLGGDRSGNRHEPARQPPRLSRTVPSVSQT